jgi:hypothetical protein
MTPEEFGEAIKIQTSDAAALGTIAQLQRPSGRKPREGDVRLSRWYQQLTNSDREMLHESLKKSAQLAVFSFLCVLDGVSVIESTPEKGDLELYFVKGDKRTLLNDPKHEELHNLYNRRAASESLRD